MSFRAQVFVGKHWINDAVKFATLNEATRYAQHLETRYIPAPRVRVIEDDEAPDSVWKWGMLQSI
jgi:hypothetical protein